MPKHSELTSAQRREAVLALLRREEPAAQLARRWGISEQTLYRWRDEFLAGGEAALANGKNGADGRDREIRELRAQLEERNLVIGELTVANRLLKNSRARRADGRSAASRGGGTGWQRGAATDAGTGSAGDREQQLVSPAGS